MKTFWKTELISDGEVNYLDQCGDLADAIRKGNAKLVQLSRYSYRLKRKMRKKVVEVPV